MKRVRILYFAELAEQAKCAERSVQSDSSTLFELYDSLRQEHGFRFTQSQLKPARNGQFSSWDAAFEEGDEVSFLPPFSGG